MLENFRANVLKGNPKVAIPSRDQTLNSIEALLIRSGAGGIEVSLELKIILTLICSNFVFNYFVRA